MTTGLQTTGTVPEWTRGDRLRKAREVAGYNQTELAQIIGVARTTVAGAEQHTREPRRPVLVAWSLACGVPLQWVETGETPPPNDGGGVSDVRPEGLEPPTSWLGVSPQLTSIYTHRGWQGAGRDVTPTPRHKVA